MVSLAFLERITPGTKQACSADLLEADFFGLFSESLSRHVQAIFSNDTSMLFLAVHPTGQWVVSKSRPFRGTLFR